MRLVVILLLGLAACDARERGHNVVVQPLCVLLCYVGPGGATDAAPK